MVIMGDERLWLEDENGPEVAAVAAENAEFGLERNEDFDDLPFEESINCNLFEKALQHSSISKGFSVQTNQIQQQIIKI